MTTSSPLFLLDLVPKVLSFHPQSMYRVQLLAGSSRVPWHRGGPTAYWANQEEHPQRWGNDGSPLLSPHRPHLRTVSVVGPAIQERHHRAGVSSGESLWGGQGLAAGMGPLQPGADAASEGLHSSLPVRTGGL